MIPYPWLTPPERAPRPWPPDATDRSRRLLALGGGRRAVAGTASAASAGVAIASAAAAAAAAASAAAASAAAASAAAASDDRPASTSIGAAPAAFASPGSASAVAVHTCHSGERHAHAGRKRLSGTWLCA